MQNKRDFRPALGEHISTGWVNTIEVGGYIDFAFNGWIEKSTELFVVLLCITTPSPYYPTRTATSAIYIWMKIGWNHKYYWSESPELHIDFFVPFGSVPTNFISSLHHPPATSSSLPLVRWFEQNELWTQNIPLTHLSKWRWCLRWKEAGKKETA